MTINKLSVSVKIQVHTVRRALLIVHVTPISPQIQARVLTDRPTD